MNNVTSLPLTIQIVVLALAKRYRKLKLILFILISAFSGITIAQNVGSLSNSSKNGSKYTDYWIVSFDYGEVVKIKLSSDDFDSVLKLISPSGQIYEDDDSGDGLNAFIQLPINEQGCWKIEVSSYENQQGTYYLDVDSISGSSTRDYCSRTSEPNPLLDSDSTVNREVCEAKLSEDVGNFDYGYYYIEKCTIPSQSILALAVNMERDGERELGFIFHKDEVYLNGWLFSGMLFSAYTEDNIDWAYSSDLDELKSKFRLNSWDVQAPMLIRLPGDWQNVLTYIFAVNAGPRSSEVYLSYHVRTFGTRATMYSAMAGIDLLDWLDGHPESDDNAIEDLNIASNNFQDFLALINEDWETLSLSTIKRIAKHIVTNAGLCSEQVIEAICGFYTETIIDIIKYSNPSWYISIE